MVRLKRCIRPDGQPSRRTGVEEGPSTARSRSRSGRWPAARRVAIAPALKSPKPLFSVIAHDVDAAGVSFDAEIPSAWLDAELAELGAHVVPGSAPARVTARISRAGDAILVRGRIHASLTTPCARCLDPAAIDVDTELSLLLRVDGAAKKGAPAKLTAVKPVAVKPAAARPVAARLASQADKAEKPAKAKDEEYEFTAEEADVDTYDGETVVLDGFVREVVLLEVPNFPLCSEDCPGIRPAAASAPEAAAPRVDPRLAPLGALRGLVRDGGGSPEPPQKKKKKE